MKPQSLQDAILNAANNKKDRFSKGEWKDPVVKQHKITAEDMKASKSGGSGASGGGGGGGADTAALQQEIELLRQEMRNSLKQIKDEQQRQQSTPTKTNNNSNNDEQTMALKRELESVRADLKDMRSILSGVELIPDELQELREDMRDMKREGLDSNGTATHTSSLSSSNGNNNNGAAAAVDDTLLKDVKKVKVEIKELRLMVVESKDSSALAKELRVIVDQQETMLETHAEEIEDLKEQVRLLKRRLETAEFNAKEAVELAKRRPASGDAAENASGDGSGYQDYSAAVPQVIPMSPTNRPPRSSRGNNSTNNNSSGSSNPLHFEAEEEPPEGEDDDDEHDTAFLAAGGAMMNKDNKNKPSRSNKQERQQELYGAAGGTDSNLLHLDSDDDESESTDGSDLFPVNESNGEKLLSRTGRNSNSPGGSKGRSKKTSFSPSSIVLDKDGTYNYNTTDDDNDDTDESYGQDDDDDEDDEDEEEEEEDDDDEDEDENSEMNEEHNHNQDESVNNSSTSSTPSPEAPVEEKEFHKSPPARSSSFDRDIENIPRAGTTRPPPARAPQNDSSDDDGSSSSSESDVTPKKKTISLLPHRSDALYQEQRKDSVLRKFIANGKTPNMTVHTVHGKNLVFFSDKVYIPASLRQQSMEYYHKKHAYNPLFAIQKHCFWPDMEDDMNKFGKKETRWRVVPSSPKKGEDMVH